MPRRRPAVGGPDGVLLVDKPAGPTSAAVVDWVRWVFGGHKAGHCGTLDPAATGLVVVALGRGTRWVEWLTEDDKVYRARFELGRSTDTADAEGRTVHTAEVSEAMVGRAEAVVRSWIGDHQLPPPAYSAVKVQGQRAHALARAGEAVELAPRPMTVRAVEAVASGPTYVEATLTVSKGTYIRSLAEALGEAIACPVHLARLHRRASGKFSVDDPRVVREMTVTPLGPDPRGKPRHRLRAALAPETREGQQDWLRSRIVDLVAASPLPVRVAEASASAALEALAAGRAVSAADAAPLVAGGVERWVVVGPQGAPILVVSAAEDGSVRAARTVLPAPARGGAQDADGAAPRT